MKILVCIKEVQDLGPDIEVMIDEATNWIKEDESSRYMMNRYDEFAVEEALLIKEKASAVVDVLSVGQERSQAVVRRAMGMGADHGIHIQVDNKGFSGPFYIAELISRVSAQKHYDLILTGVMAEDTQQGQTGPMIAEMLGIPWSTSVIQTDIAEDCGSIQIERELEAGKRELWQLELPCLLTIQSGINQPRYPALSKVLRAKKAELEIIRAEDVSKSENIQSVNTIAYPLQQRAGAFLEGTPVEKARKLVKLFSEKSFLK